MKLLLTTAFRYKKHYMLLGVTFVFMMLLTLTSQMEMLSIGVITKSGPDFFALFSPEKDGHMERVEALSREDVQAHWDQISDGSNEITKHDAAVYLSKRKDKNPLNALIMWISGKSGFLNNMAILAGVLLFVAIMKAVAFFGSNYSRELVMIRVQRDLKQQYFEHIQTLSLDFYQKYNVGSLSVRVGGDATAVATAIYSSMVAYIQTPIALITTLFICFRLSWQLSLLVFIGFPLVILPILYLTKKIKRLARKSQVLGEQSSSMLLDLLSGIQTIKLFAMEGFAIKRFKEQNNRVAKLAQKGARYGYMARPILHLFSTGLIAGIILYGIYIAHLGVPEVLTFCALIFLIYEPLKKLSDENMKIQGGIVAAERMYEVLNLRPQIADHPDAVPLLSFSKAIEFDNVWFRYLDEWVLKGLSFTAERGQVVALVGPTGAGKSTVANLLPRLYEPQKGEIRIDGKPLAAYTQKSVRELIGSVSQKPFIFLDTVAENIAFGRDFSREEIELAARRAHADEYIQRLPNKYDTMLAERGKNLSGGQQQRLAIARTLVKGAPILIMDEATSSLDAVSENNIKEAINDLRGDVTQILIAHRLSTIEHADKIIFIDHGEVTAQGTKDELLEICPEFRVMWDMMHRDTANVVA